MRKTFTLNKPQYAVLFMATRGPLSIPYQGRTIVLHRQHAVNAAWECLGKQLGFLPGTTRHMSSHGARQFSATCSRHV